MTGIDHSTVEIESFFRAQRVNAKFKSSHCRVLLSELFVVGKLVVHVLGPGVLESGVCQDQSEEDDRGNDVGETLATFQQRE